MRVCDRHPAEKAVESIILEREDTRSDLCAACVQLVREFLSEQKPLDRPKRGRPPKN